MDETQDTFDRLLAEFREHAAGVQTSGYVTMSGRDFHKMLDRFDAAHKREKAAIEADALAVGEIVGASHKRETATTEKSSAVGDCAKLRDALEDARNFLLKHCCGSSEAQAIISRIDCALAAPPRNCDIGTAEEQAERYGRYCDKFTSDGMHCETCPCCGKIPFGKCEFAWAQMPYNEGGAE